MIEWVLVLEAQLGRLLCPLPGWPQTGLLELAPVNWEKTLQHEDAQRRLAANVFRQASLGLLDAHLVPQRLAWWRKRLAGNGIDSPTVAQPAPAFLLVPPASNRSSRRSETDPSISPGSLPGRRSGGFRWRMLRMDQVHVVRHNILVEGIPARRVARPSTGKPEPARAGKARSGE